jgi:glycerol uptake facilitator protein
MGGLPPSEAFRTHVVRFNHRETLDAAGRRSYLQFEMLFHDVEQHSDSRDGGEKPAACHSGRVQPTGERMAAAPTTPQKLLAELVGTACLVFVGAGSAAATGVLAASSKAPFSLADLGMISFAFMLVIVGVVYAIGHISGGHINPAVTLSLAVSGKFPWRQVPGYMAAQLVGAIIGAAAIFVTLGKTAAIAAGGGVTHYDAATMGFGRALLIEAIGTAILVFVIFGVIDHRAVPGWAPMAIGAIVFAIIIIVGPATGAAINPARYLGAVLMFGAFGGHPAWSQIPAYLIGELAGGVLGGLAYVGMSKVRQDAALTSLAPDPDSTVEAIREKTA